MLLYKDRRLRRSSMGLTEVKQGNRKTLMIALSMSAIIVTGLLSGCGGKEIGPKEVLSAYIEALQENRISTAYEMLSTDDQSAFNLAEYEDIAGMDVFVQDFTVTSLSAYGDTALVKVDVVVPDLRNVLGGLLETMFKSALSDDQSASRNPLSGLSEEDIRDIPKMTVERDYTLHREADGWRVYLDLRKLKNLELAVAIAEEASKLFNQGKYQAALAKYEEASKMSSESDIYAGSIRRVEARIQQEETKKAEEEARKAEEKKKSEYLTKYISIEDVEYGESRDWLDGIIKTIEYKVRNTGSLTVRRMVLRVFYLDENGKKIGEDDFYPVNPYSDKSPLKPNYIAECWGNLTEDAPPGWSGEVSYELVDIEFGE